MEYKGKSLQELLERNARDYSDKVAYVYQGESFTWQQVKEDVDLAATTLLSSGVVRGDHVGILGVNSYRWIIGMFACVEIGAVGILANCEYHVDELLHFLSYGKVSTLLYSNAKHGRSYEDDLAQIASECPLLQKKIHFSELLASSKDEEALAKAKAAATLEDTAYVIFTSGTTKRPKGVQLSQGGVLRMARTIADRLELTEQDRQVVAVPLFHGSGANACIMPGVQAAATSVILEGYSSVGVMKAIEQYRCTVYNAVPQTLLLMLNNNDFGRYDLSSLRCGIWAGSAVTEENYERLKKEFGFFNFVLAYGQTEATTLSTMTELHGETALGFAMCGKPLPDVELRIWDEANGCCAPVGGEGEIQINGYTKMQGYLDMPEENAKKYTADGWMRTGDKGRLTPSGDLEFLGRMDDMIIRGGENISPAEIESTICRYSPDVLQVKVLGVDSELFGQEVVAFFTSHTKVAEEEMHAFLTEHLANCKVPSAIARLEVMPILENGKIDVKSLRKRAADLLKAAQKARQ